MKSIEDVLKVGSRYRLWMINSDNEPYTGEAIDVLNGWIEIQSRTRLMYVNLAQVEQIHELVPNELP